jgi:hypothetical protein
LSAIISVAIQCDHCGRRAPDQANTAWQVRFLSADLGWHRNNGHDVCPACWRNGARGPIVRKKMEMV